MKYWLISDEDVEKIRKIAKRAYLNIGCAGSDNMKNEFFHTLDTGLHKTDCISVVMAARITQNRLSKSECDKTFLTVVKFGLTGGALGLGLSRSGVRNRLRRIEHNIQGALFYPYDYDTLTRKGEDYLRSIENDK